MIKEFIDELDYNQQINNKKGLENRINIDYVSDRLKGIYIILKDYLKGRESFCNDCINHYIDNDENEAIKYMYARQEIEAFKALLEEVKREDV